MRAPLFLSLLVTLTTISTSNPLYAVSSKPETFYYTLDNGLRLIVRPDHRAPVAVTQVWYQVGSSYEYEGITGISHMLEHLMFKGTKTYPAGEFVSIIAENGGDQNAFTSLDYTVYYEELEARRIPLAFELEADRMRNIDYTDEELLTERDVVAEERRLRTEDNPVARMYERFNAIAQVTSPYRHPVVGWMDDINRYTRSDIETWYDKWYAPNNAIVVVVGDVEPKTIYQLAEHHFGKIPPSQHLSKDIPTLKPPPAVPPLGERRIEVATPSLIPYLYLGYNVPVVNTANETWEPYALDVLVGVLAGGESARLSRTLVREQLMASEVGAIYNPFDRLDTVLILGGVPTQNHTPEELEAALRQQVQVMQTALVSPQELQRVKTQVIANEIYARDSMTQQALQIGSLASVGLSPELVDEYVNNINAVTAEQVQQVAQRYLTSERLTVGILVPETQTKVPAPAVAMEASAGSPGNAEMAITPTTTAVNPTASATTTTPSATTATQEQAQ
ncbi:MAG: M16 family metallopeptidase [Gammaproteobacteria bacterium]